MGQGARFFRVADFAGCGLRASPFHRDSFSQRITGACPLRGQLQASISHIRKEARCLGHRRKFFASLPHFVSLVMNR